MWWLSDSGRPQIYRKQTSTPVMGYGDDSRVYTADVHWLRWIGWSDRPHFCVAYEMFSLSVGCWNRILFWSWRVGCERIPQRNCSRPVWVKMTAATNHSLSLFLSSSSSCSHDVRNVEHSLLLPLGRGFYDWNLTPFLCPISNRAVTHIKDSQRRITARP